MTNLTKNPSKPASPGTKLALAVLLTCVLLAAAYFRLSGTNWGEYQYLHPDERFLVWVGSDISPVHSFSDYFDTPNSSLNPNNRGHGFYVYGTFPMIATRYIVEWVYGQSGFKEMTDVGRAGSAIADFGTVLLVFMIGNRLYNPWAGLLSAAFSAGAVLQIQQAHFFTMDSFAVFFSTLAFYFAVLALKNRRMPESGSVEAEEHPDAELPPDPAIARNIRFWRDPLFWASLGFGIALGMAVASKLNAVAIAMALPVAFVLVYIRLPESARERSLTRFLLYLIIAAFISLFVFRLLQPYAFSGPGLFGIGLNPQWVQNIREQRAQSGGNMDYPPAMQWARRPVWFSLQNMVLWGLGLPLGLLAWAGFLWAGWILLTQIRQRTPEWSSHALLWSWTFVYFVWQSLQLNPTMRYQLPIYPSLAIFGGWAIAALYDLGRRIRQGQTGASHGKPNTGKWIQAGSLALGCLVLILTFIYAFAFTQIYTRPITRIAASRWIYENIRASINLTIQDEKTVIHQILPFHYDSVILPELPYSVGFQPDSGGLVTEVFLPDVTNRSAQTQPLELSVSIYPSGPKPSPLATANAVLDVGQSGGGELLFKFDPPARLDPLMDYNLVISLPSDSDPAAELKFANRAELVTQPVTGLPVEIQEGALDLPAIRTGMPLQIDFQAKTDGRLIQVNLERIDEGGALDWLKVQSVQLITLSQEGETISTSALLDSPSSRNQVTLQLADPLPLKAAENYRMWVAFDTGGPVIELAGQGLANEGEWDDGLPVRLDGRDGFGGIYPQGLDFNMYWDDNPEKLERFLRILDEADYLAISSNRQWGTLPRIPERFPLTSLYYRELLGCPAGENIVDCYRKAEPGSYQGNLGFELVKTWVSEPSLGPLRLNDQYAEEAFTVYDHPKVFIFKKTDDYDPEKVRRILSSADLAHILRKPPLQYSGHPEDLTLPADRWQAQKAGGTWSELFPSWSPLNRSPALAVLAWYLTVAFLGLLFYPILRLALPGLEDHGYPLGRIAGMLSLAYLTWLAGSFQVPFSRTTISAVFFLLACTSIASARLQGEALLREIKNRKRYFFWIEVFFLVFFSAFLLVRIGNPDLWHPWKGGEKPMDFAYFNAVLKSTSFPPYDPWFAKGYLNYYYFGFVVVGVLVKWLGIQPAVAYNLILPTLFSLIAMGAFSLAWNLSQRGRAVRTGNPIPGGSRLSPYIPALAASIGMVVLGNLGTVKMIGQGFQRLGASGAILEEANLLEKWGLGIQGFLAAVKGASLPYGTGDWYWNPSRIIPAPGDIEPITEFPFFTLLYADLHAHLIAIPLTLLVLTLLLGIVFGKARFQKPAGAAAWFLLAGLAVGSLRPTNTWDLPLYLLLGVIAVGYAGWMKPHQARLEGQIERLPGIPANPLRWVRLVLYPALLVALAFLLYIPFSRWYALGYTQVGLWEGTHTPISAFFNHWAVFLIVIIPWMIWETRDWLAKTPLSAVQNVRLFLAYLQLSIFLIFVIAFLLVFWRGIAIAWIVLPAAVWAGALVLRSGQPDSKRAVLLMVAAGFLMTLMVEVIVLRGDIGRMNTVFKFYLQVWTLFSISAAAALAWLWPALDHWKPAWRNFWFLAFILLTAGASLYPLMAATAKIKDRMAVGAPHTLDGMRYMAYAAYTDEWGEMDLSQDYNAIRWMQEHVTGSPVIVEANLRDLYRWGSRFSIYTGLPGVVGWEWHQQQQRTSIPGTWITERILEVDGFYLTTDWEAASAFLKKYQVEYIILGQQERGHYAGPGLQKFEDANGVLWTEVFRDRATVIYRVSEEQP